MTDRPILKWPNPRSAARARSGRRHIPKRPAQIPSRARQGERLAGRMDPIIRAFLGNEPSVTLRADPTGIAPERALVFETAAPVGNFARAARDAGLEMFAEYTAEEIADLGDEDTDFRPPEGEEVIYPTLYATMPSEGAFRAILRHWRAFRAGRSAPNGMTPWWHLFELLFDLRTWGPQDRLNEAAARVIEDRLPEDDDEEMLIEIELWPSRKQDLRTRWRSSVRETVENLGGRIVDASAIDERGFVYDALLVGLRAGDVRVLLQDPLLDQSLAGLDGVQFILPQTIAQSSPRGAHTEGEDMSIVGLFEDATPARAVLMDGVPVAAHPALSGGVIIEDVHDIERRSTVADRYHGTAMASLILRGDLGADGSRLRDSRLISVPVLVDGPLGAHSPSERLFVDVLHTALARCFTGEEPLAPDAFVVNLSIGIDEQRFAGRVSALARLLDWWSWNHGVLFAVSAGNISEDLTVPGVTSAGFEDQAPEDKQRMMRDALNDGAYARSLLAPAEALNVLTVGALSQDLSPKRVPDDPSLVRFETGGDEFLPHMSTALGLGPAKAMKPDVLSPGGIQEMRIKAAGNDTRLGVSDTQRTGLVVAAPVAVVGNQTTRCRGTSAATALTTRSLLLAAEALMEEDGPLSDLDLGRSQISLATRALAVNAAAWPDTQEPFHEEAMTRLGAQRATTTVRDQVARHFGYGVLEPVRMVDGPTNGATLIGLGTIRKDQAKLFRLALPPSLSGERLPRSLRVTLAWFSPVEPSRAIYRCAALDATSVPEEEDETFRDWKVRLKGVGPDSNMAGRGTVWSRRLVAQTQRAPEFEAGDYIPIRVQCREVGAGGLTPDDDIDFAIAASFEIEGEVRFDVYQEIREQVRLRVRR